MATLFPHFSQDTRLLRLMTPLGPDRLLVECVRGEEALSRHYSFQLSLLSTDAHIPLKSLLGQPALLELLTSSPGRRFRPFHGHITSARLAGADGGFARYDITIEPWFALMAIGRDSRVFQDKTVFDILDAVFDGWSSLGKLVPDWRYDISERRAYPVRSLTCQYQESNLAFAERLMHEEGLFYYFEHHAEADSPSFGKHTLVIADHNGSFKPNEQAEVRFTQSGAVMREDSIDGWRTVSRPVAGDVSISSWDYRATDTRPVCASAPARGMQLTSRDSPGAYAYPGREQGERIANNQLQALQVSRESHTGDGTVRTLAPGTTFTLRGQAQLDRAQDDDARTFAIVRVLHVAHNNLSTELQSTIAQALGESWLSKSLGSEGDGLHGTGTTISERPLYRNRIEAIRSNIPYRSSSVDGHGTLLHPRPTVKGQQTAIVVGPPGAVVHTDRDHRIKVQFHWQRNAGSNDLSHSRLNHPAPRGQTGAPADDRSGTWVRVVSTLAPIAGANWGGVAVPRVGSEVLIDFIDGNIDRPVVIGSLYNGAGVADAQRNQVQGTGVATGNAPAWFPGEAGAHAHPAALSGIKTQAMRASQGGGGAYNQLVFDDSPGQARIALQSHASPHEGTAELNMGHLRHQSDNQRLATVGFGAELKTGHSAALRAGKGLLLSSDACDGASGGQLDSREAHAQVAQGHSLQVALAGTAHKHNAMLKDDQGQSAGQPGELAAIAAVEHSVDVLNDAEAAGEKGYREPLLQMSSPAGIAATTPADAMFAAGQTGSVTAGQDINLAAQGNSFHAAKDGISLFTYGKASAKDKPNQETGIRLHAASGKVSCQSQSGETRITSDKAITVASVAKGVTVAAKKHLLMTAQGASLKLEGGNIMLHGPGKIEFKASMKELAGPMDGSVALAALPKAKDIFNEAFVVVNEETNAPLPYVRYRLESASGIKIEGITDAQGRTQRIFTSRSEMLTLHLPDDE